MCSCAPIFLLRAPGLEPVVRADRLRGVREEDCRWSYSRCSIQAIKSSRLSGGDAGSLVGEIRGDIAIGKDQFALFERGGELLLGLEAVSGVKKRGEVWVNGLERAEIAVQELPDHFSEPGFVVRKPRRIDGHATRR